MADDNKKKLNELSAERKQEAAEIKSLSQELTRLQRQQEDYSRKAFANFAAGRSAAAKYNDEMEDLLARDVRALQQKINKTKELGNENEKLRQKKEKQLQEEEAAEKRLKQIAKDKATAFRDISKTLANLPGIGGVLSDVFSKAAQVVEETGSKAAGFLSVMKSIATVAGPTAIIKSMLTISDQTQDISRNLGLGFEAAREMRKEFSQIAKESNDVRITSEKLIKAQTEIQKAFGLSVNPSSEISENFIRNSEYLGASTEAAGKLEKIIATTGQNSEDFSNQLAVAANKSGEVYGIHLPLAKVVENIKNLQGEVLVSLLKQPQALVESVALSEKFGLSLSETRNIAQGLTDFQTSIRNEVEAEVLLNRDLNLERARGLAFTGQYVKLQAEIGKQIGTVAEFEAMLPIQREAYAKALGLSVDKLAEMVMQNELSVRFGEQARDLSMEQLQAARDLAAAQGLSDGEALRQIQEQVSASKRFEDAAAKIKTSFQDAFVQAAPLLEKLADLVGKMAKDPFAKVLAISAAGIGTLFAAMTTFKGLTPATAQWVRVVGAPGTAAGGMMMGGGTGAGTKMVQAKSGKMYAANSPQGKMILTKGGTQPLPKGGMTGMGAGMLGMGGMIAGQAVMASSDDTSVVGQSFGQGLSMAGTGAMAGSMFGLQGAAVGAAIGGLYGLATGYLDAKEAQREAKRQEYEERRSMQDPLVKELQMMRKALDNSGTTINMDGQMLGKIQENRPYNGMNKPILS